MRYWVHTVYFLQTWCIADSIFMHAHGKNKIILYRVIIFYYQIKIPAFILCNQSKSNNLYLEIFVGLFTLSTLKKKNQFDSICKKTKGFDFWRMLNLHQWGQMSKYICKRSKVSSWLTDFLIYSYYFVFNRFTNYSQTIHEPIQIPT